ncbi:MAG: hypothetical protein AB1757_26705 [Acidobacteriota bacterium]
MMKKLSIAMLSLVIMFGAVNAVNAQNFGGSMSTKDKVKWIGGAAAAGAVIGGLLNGKKGAVIGAAVGAGAGAGTVYIKGKREEERYGRYYDRRYRDNDRYENGRYRNYSRFDNNRRGCR